MHERHQAGLSPDHIVIPNWRYNLRRWSMSRLSRYWARTRSCGPRTNYVLRCRRNAGA